jgi:hypothetical protein
LDDPYRLALAATSDRGTMADSMYVLAEADLRRRLDEIRMLFEPAAADTIQAAEPTAEPTPEGGVEDAVEF